jgi:hypothetical protein
MLIMNSLKVLHVGWGFIPWRGGGLIEYAEDLMTHQIDLGWDARYFFSGRKYPFSKRTRLKQWRLRRIKCYEIVNSPIIHGGDSGTSQPCLQLNEAISEDLFRRVLKDFCPDIIHIHELAGLPTSLIEIATCEFSIPTLMTLADYYLLCPTLKLYDARGHNC